VKLVRGLPIIAKMKKLRKLVALLFLHALKNCSLPYHRKNGTILPCKGQIRENLGCQSQKKDKSRGTQGQGSGTMSYTGESTEAQELKGRGKVHGLLLPPSIMP
jgi:hypothetical protein